MIHAYWVAVLSCKKANMRHVFCCFRLSTGDRVMAECHKFQVWKMKKKENQHESAIFADQSWQNLSHKREAWLWFMWWLKIKFPTPLLPCWEQHELLRKISLLTCLFLCFLQGFERPHNQCPESSSAVTHTGWKGGNCLLSKPPNSLQIDLPSLKQMKEACRTVGFVTMLWLMSGSTLRGPVVLLSLCLCGGKPAHSHYHYLGTGV